LSSASCCKSIDQHERQRLDVRTLRQWIEQRRDASSEPGTEDLAARVERLEHAIFPDTKAS
jgi:hypothetical protein